MDESDVTEETFLKLIKITVFLVQQHWAHITNYDKFVQFVGIELQEKVPTVFGNAQIREVFVR